MVQCLRINSDARLSGFEFSSVSYCVVVRKLIFLCFGFLIFKRVMIMTAVFPVLFKAS